MTSVAMPTKKCGFPSSTFFLLQRDGKLRCQADPKLLNSRDPSFLSPTYLGPWVCATRPSTFSLKFTYCVYVHERTSRSVDSSLLPPCGLRGSNSGHQVGGGRGGGSNFPCRAIFPAPRLAFSVQHCICQIYSCFCLWFVYTDRLLLVALYYNIPSYD